MFSSSTFDQFTIFCFFVCVIYAAICDYASFRIPNKICAAILLLFPLHAIVSPVAIDWFGALVAAGGVLFVGFLLFARGIAGAGDVKLLAATALWAGRSLVVPELLTTALAGGALAAGSMAVQMSRRYRASGPAPAAIPALAAAAQAKVPYGIAIAAGALFVGFKLLGA